MKKSFWCLLAGSLLLFWSCNGEDKKAISSMPSSDVYLDYKVSAEEGAEYAVVLLHFRKGDEDDAAIALDPGSQVLFDGAPLEVDSARLTGVYYEVQHPLAGFEGRHVITYKNKAGQVLEQPFTFTPLRLENSPLVIGRQPLVLQLGKSGGKGKIQVLLTDTSFQTADINEEYTVNDGKIEISEQALRKVVNGPVTLELVKEEVQRLPKGRLSITHTLRRELELK